METNISQRPHMNFRHRWVAASIVFTMAVVLLGLFGVSKPEHASAAAPPPQCDGEQNVGGQEVACTVTVVNYVTSAGALSATPPSTLVMTRCVGASGPLNTLTCTTTTTTSSQPITTIDQCNGSGNGGGGTVICTTTVTNHFTGSPAAITPATVYQGVGSVITGTGAPGTFTPANTPGITSIAAATVGQCNGSGNGGTSVGMVCIVTVGSTMTPTLPVNVNQCNNSANGGGALTTCTATVMNDVIAQPATPTVAPGTATPTVSATATVAPATATPTVAATTTATITSTSTATPTVVPSGAPRPPATGNSGPGATSQGALWMLGVAATLLLGSFVLAGRRIASRQRNR